MNDSHEKPSADSAMEKTVAPPSYIAEANTSPSCTTFASVSLHMSDRLRLLRFPPTHIQAITRTIQSSWGQGIQIESNYYGAHEFKLHGRPWDGKGSQADGARVLMCRLLESLFNLGWILSAATDVSKKQYDKDTLLLRLVQPAPPPCDWIGIAFSHADRLRVVFADGQLLQALRAVLGRRVQESRRISGLTHEFKLHGYPWRANGGETMAVRVMLLELLDCLEVQGFSLYASIDQKTGPASSNDNGSEADTWYLCRAKNWTAGMPVYGG
ncbi:hypothetical protein B0A49_04389 [Cryomyces minteri]|uniref:Uncharacterized protein n=1 Tax=Cryomyces minteri TaxID=331657 RepID=A0A4V5NFE6_9PEZI|nr:hypothetical protein B0A49_04389 [Cryomyces minteri]